jgi:hypothetical protein
MILPMVLMTPQQAQMMSRPTVGHRIKGVVRVIWPLKFPPTYLSKNKLIWATSRHREPADPSRII